MTALIIMMSMLASACVDASDIFALLQTHVSFATSAAMFWALGKMAKSLAPPASTGGVWEFYWRTLPHHPVLSGAVMGAMFPHLLPESAGAGRVAAALYFGASGVLATYGHNLFRTWVKYRNQS